MSEPALAVARRWLERLANGDVAPELCDPEVEIRNWAEAPLPGPYNGHEGLQRWWADIEDVLDNARFELHEAEEVDAEHVLTLQHIIGRFRHTGIEVDNPWGSIVKVRDGKILGATGYPSPNSARRAAEKLREAGA